MQVKYIEATHGSTYGGGNWGKFMLARFEVGDWAYRSALPEALGRSLLAGRGWSPAHLLFLDLQTGEGCILRPGGVVHSDLQKHAIWICPMAEPFLEWLYRQDLSDLQALPALVELPEAEFSYTGYRRPGIEREALSVAQELVEAHVAGDQGSLLGLLERLRTLLPEREPAT